MKCNIEKINAVNMDFIKHTTMHIFGKKSFQKFGSQNHILTFDKYFFKFFLSVTIEKCTLVNFFRFLSQHTVSTQSENLKTEFSENFESQILFKFLKTHRLL